MQTMRNMILSILLSVIFLAGCLDDPANIDPPGDGPYSPEEQQVIANCYTVQQAVEAFAADNGGVYPSDISADMTPSGDTVIDLLPGGTYLENPFQGVNTVPNVGAAAYPGETGYVPTMDGGVVIDYVISGFGESDIILTLTKDGPLN